MIFVMRDSVTDVFRKRSNLWERKNARWWRVRRGNEWLHMNGETWTTDKRYLYLGTTTALNNLASVSPALKDSDDWTPVEVTKEVHGR
jgi:hypothetical protein